MSMRDYPVDTYGLLLNKETMKILAKKICEDYTDEDYDEDPYGFNELITDKFGRIDYISNFDGEGIPIDENGCDNYGGDIVYFSEDPVYILVANNTPSLFSAAYKNMDEMASEFERLLGSYLPNLNYRSNIKHFVGTYFG